MDMSDVCTGDIYLFEVEGNKLLEGVKNIGETAVIKVSVKDKKENQVVGTVRVGDKFIPAMVDVGKLIEKTYDSWTVEP